MDDRVRYDLFNAVEWTATKSKSMKRTTNVVGDIYNEEFDDSEKC